MHRNKPGILGALGPGIVIAATGVGAGDLVAAAVCGAVFGTRVLWAVLAGALLKFVLNEGLARWQLATGTTLLEGWDRRLPRLFFLGFLTYLFLWSFVVAGALMAACGMAAHAIVPALPVPVWGALHSLAALLLVLLGRYQLLERLMKGLIALMFLVVMTCAVLTAPGWGEILSGLLPVIPSGQAALVIGLIGGVGGSVTLLSYGYWIRERNWRGPEHLTLSRVDLGVAYLLTGLFGMAVIVVAAGVRPEVATGSGMVLGLAEQVGSAVGEAGRWCFLVGFWGAVFSSMLGVWQGVPYIFADSVHILRQRSGHGMPAAPLDRSPAYRAWLVYLALPPMALLLAAKPVWLVMAYAVSGALFMPVLAATLLILNNRQGWIGRWRNGPAGNILLILALLLFGVLLLQELLRWLAG
jgi:Mn2+/Fe2+ NRAMP family transporter